MPRIWAPVSALALAAACLAACTGPSSGAGAGLALARPPQPTPQPHLYPGRLPSFLQVGMASWYGDRFKRRPTASGEPFDPKDITAAHRTLPLQTIARVTNLSNGRSILVRINDRGPYAQGRIIDLSRNAATRLGMKQDGVAQVRVEVFDTDQAAAVRTRTASAGR